MNLHELFEEEDEIGIRDPKARQALIKARSEYSGVADNDLEAFIAMMQDQQDKQDGSIDSQYHVNIDQEDEIGGNDAEIEQLDQRVSALEKGTQAESINEDSDSPLVGFEHVSDDYGNDTGHVRAVIYQPDGRKVANIIEATDIITLVDMLDDEYGWNWKARGADGKPLTSDTLSRAEMAEIALDGGKQDANEFESVGEAKGLDEGPIDWAGRKLKVKITKGRPKPKHAPKWANFMAQTPEGAWHWLEQKSVIIGDTDQYFPEAGKTEFSGFVSPPSSWKFSLMPVNDGYTGVPKAYGESINEGPADNFTADDLQALNSIRDLPTLKARAMELIANPNSTRPMKPEKVAWFQRAVDSKTKPAAIIKLMWDLLLSGEGQGVNGSRFSTDKNSYRKSFNEGQKPNNTQQETKMKIKDIMESKKALTEAKVVKGSLQLIESVIAMLEDNSIDWESQPDYKGVKGKTTASGPGERLGRVNKAAQAGDKTNQIWMKLLKQYKTLGASGQRQMQGQLAKMAQSAQGRGIQLTPDPSKIGFIRNAQSNQFA